MTPVRLLVLPLLLAVGCSSTETEPTEERPARPAEAPVDYDQGLEPERTEEAPVEPPLPYVATGSSATIDGRKVVVMRAEKRFAAPYEVRFVYELRDAATQESLHTWGSLADGYVRGVSCVLLISGFGLLELVPAEVDEYLCTPERGASIAGWLSRYRDHPTEGFPRWSKLDLPTKTLVETDITFVEGFAIGTRWAYALTHRLGAQRVGDRLLGRLDLELVSDAGEPLGRYERVRWPMQVVGGLRLIRAHQADGAEVNHLLGPRLEPLSVTTGRMLIVGGALMTQAPGTTPEENLWVAVGTDGQPVRTPGIIGYRPVWPGCDPSSVAPMFFLARHAEGAPHAWGRADAPGAPSTSSWDAVELYRPPTLYRLFKFENIRPDEYHKRRDGKVSPLDNSILLVQSGGRWEASSTVPGAANDPRIVTSGATPDEALTAAFARYEERFAALQEAARWENPDNKDRRYFDDWVAGRIDEREVDLGRVEWLAKKYGGAAVFHYVRFLYSRARPDTLYNLKPYFDWAAENADRSDVSDGDRAWLQAESPRVDKARADVDADTLRAHEASEEQRRREREIQERQRELWASPQPAPAGAAPTYTPSSSGTSAPGAYQDYYDKQYDDTIKRYGG